MKQIKRIVALMLTFIMVMGMSVTAFAEETPEATSKTEKIVISNLSDQADIELKVYPVFTFNENNSKWDIVKWADDAKLFTEDNNEYTIKDNNYNALVNAAVNATDINYKTYKTEKATTYTIPDVVAGAYLIVATGEGVNYSPMFVKTYVYDTDNYLMYVNDETDVVAKGSDSKTTKEASDYFVANGDTVTFTVKTIIPYGVDVFIVKDEPTNLDDLKLTSVKIGNSEVYDTTDEAYKRNIALSGGLNNPTETEKAYTVDLSQYVSSTYTGDDKGLETYVGMNVTIKYSATVNGIEGYSNKAYTNVNSEQNGTEVKAHTGAIILTKKDKENQKILTGAEFTVTKDDTDILWFTKDSDGVYTLSKEGATEATQTIVATNGTVTIRGISEGKYHFTETKAPEGYSINTIGADAEITKKQADETNDNIIIQDVVLEDTTLASLPSAGGIGTTIFTIAGVILMVGAAAIYFARRRRA